MLTPKTQSNGEKEEERVIDKWGKGRGRSRKREIGHGWVMWIGAHGCGSKLMEEGLELMDVDWSSWMWIDLADARVLVCDLSGAWMNRALTVAWKGRGRRSDRHDLSLSVCASVSPSFPPSFSLCVSLKMVWSENNNGKYFTPRCPYFTVNTENIFSLIQFSGLTKQPILQKNISEISLKPKQTQP